MNILIVESPAKAKTINKYLGRDYTVLASFGHIRDLPSKDGSVRPDQDFAMEWTSDARSEKRIKEIVRAVKGSDKLFLATDPDREGEAISWHIREELRRRRALKDVEVKRVAFNAITKSAVLKAIERPRDLDQELIDAYMARRALDYLVGFTLSPVLWRKLPGSRSAGRVQSVALRLICDREAEIEVFVCEEYWSVTANMLSARGEPFQARLTHLDGEKLDKKTLRTEAAAERARKAVEDGSFAVAAIERKQVKRNPAAPFTTSTLQQEAARKLSFSATKTMTLAQRLYEGAQVKGETVGLITYMRTDGVFMAPEAIGAARALIERDWGDRYLPKGPRLYKSKRKNAQEAHEAIRPTNVFVTPKDARPALDADLFRLYDLIWRRAVASQMQSAVLDQVGVDLSERSEGTVLRATGSAVVFDGFLTLYREDRDDAKGEEDDGKTRILPPLAENEAVTVGEARKDQHFTQPPPRYSEASLVKKMEELGIGRPSTYASILHVLQDRDYVRLDQRRFLPEDRGRVVTAFLEGFFRRYVEYTFTADLENQLDDISGGRLDWKQVLRAFWKDFTSAVDGAMGLRIAQVLDVLNEDLGPHLFPPPEDGSDPRLCPSCAVGRLSLKLGRGGAFIGCSRYPECRYTRALAGEGADAGAEPIVLGTDPETGLEATLRKGPYGWYAQLGEPVGKTRPRRVGLPKDMDPLALDLDKALKLLALPREVGVHPEDGEVVKAGVGRFGPYIVHNGRYVSLKQDNVLDIGINRAVDLLAAAKGRGGASPGREIGGHPQDGAPILLREGRYGPYVDHGGLRATLPKDLDKDAVTVEKAVELLKAKAAKTGKKTSARKAASKKTAAPGKAPAKTATEEAAVFEKTQTAAADASGE